MISRLCAVVLAAGILIAGPVLAVVPPTPAEKAAIDRAGARGKLIYDIDRAGWVSTDLMLAKIGSRKSELRGYFIESDGADLKAVYYGQDEAGPYPILEIAVRDGKAGKIREIKREDVQPMTPLERRLVATRALAAQLGGIQPCTKGAMNLVMIPPTSAMDPIDLYVLSAQVEDKVYPLGGHFLFTLTADGKVAGSRQFTKSCLNMDMRAVPKGATSAMITVSHLLDPTPTEIHVFTALTSKLPVGVITGDKFWIVQGTKIDVMDVPKGLKP